jgi:hypothetical protein
MAEEAEQAEQADLEFQYIIFDPTAAALPQGFTCK